MSADGGLDLAERTLALVDGDAQVTVQRERSLLSRFARSTPTQATAVDDTSVSVLVVRDGHTGSAETNDLSDDGLRAVAGRAGAAARAAARAAGAAGEHPGLPTPAEAGTSSSHAGHDAPTAALDPEVAGRALRAAFATTATAGLEAFGIWTAGEVTPRSRRRRACASRTPSPTPTSRSSRADDLARSGWGAAASVRAGDLGGERSHARRSRASPRWIPSPSRPATIRSCSSPMRSGRCWSCSAAWPSTASPTPRTAARSSGDSEMRVAAPLIDARDDPLSSTDPAARLRRRGRAEGAADAHRRRRGARRRARHDVGGPGGRGALDRPRAGPRWLAVRSAADEPRARRRGRGRPRSARARRSTRPLVTRLWYVNTVHERTALVTGMTRDGTFLIEDGRLTAPARDVRFTDSPLRILEHTEALTSGRSLVCEGDFYGSRFATGTVAPALRATGFVVTGSSPGGGRSPHREFAEGKLPMGARTRAASPDLQQQDRVHRRTRSRRPRSSG